MKVLILPSWYSIDDRSSDGIFIKQQAKALRNNGVNIEVLYLDTHYQLSHFPHFKNKEIKMVNDEGILSYYTKQFFPPKINEFLVKKWCSIYEQLFQKYLQSTSKPDLIHAHSYTAGFAARYISKKHNIPYVITEHHNCFIDQSTPVKKITMIKNVFQNAAGIITVGKSLKDSVDRFCNKNTELIPNMIDVSSFSIPNRIKPNHPTYFISVGSLEKAKGQHILIKAFERFKKSQSRNVNLNLIGSGPAYKTLKNLINQLGLNDCVFLLGELSHMDVIEKLQESDVYCHPSFLETFGVAVAEAMTVGLPVIVTKCQGLVSQQ